MGKPSSAWPPLIFPYPSPQNWYLGEDSNSGEPTWRAEGPLQAGQIITFAPVYLEMANTILVVSADAKGAADVQLYADSPTAGWHADFVPSRFIGVPFNGRTTLAICAHSPEGGSHNPGPHAWNISLVSQRKTTANLLIQALYKKATARYPKEYEMDYGAISGPFCENLCSIYGPQG